MLVRDASGSGRTSRLGGDGRTHYARSGADNAHDSGTLPFLPERPDIEFERPGRLGLLGKGEHRLGNVAGLEEKIIPPIRKHLPRARNIDHTVDDHQRDVHALGSTCFAIDWARARCAALAAVKAVKFAPCLTDAVAPMTTMLPFPAARITGSTALTAASSPSALIRQAPSKSESLVS